MWPRCVGHCCVGNDLPDPLLICPGGPLSLLSLQRRILVLWSLSPSSHRVTVLQRPSELARHFFWSSDRSPTSSRTYSALFIVLLSALASSLPSKRLHRTWKRTLNISKGSEVGYPHDCRPERWINWASINDSQAPDSWRPQKDCGKNHSIEKFRSMTLFDCNGLLQ